MLDPNALAQLSQLRKSIEDSKDYGEGTVRGTASRFGFVSLDDGREAFLPPDEMQQVLPGDRVKVSVTENDKKKLDAKLEKLLQSDLKQFVGRYVEKGNNHFVAADRPQLSRWFFVPPKSRKNFKDGDLVSCTLARHPFGDGRAQVKIDKLLGKPNDPGIERTYMLAKFQLVDDFPQAAIEQAKQLAELPLTAVADDFADWRHLPFVTIDAASTRDMDDALYAETDDEGWVLYSAIADPSAYVSPGTPLDKEAQQRATSVYLTGGAVSMFPIPLAEEHFSLQAGQDRPALICRMRVAPDGSINHYEFTNAIIQSQHKLSYQEVADFLEQPDTELRDKPTTQLLLILAAISQARRNYREQHSLVQEDSVDYHYQLDDQKKICAIHRKTPTPAHRIVEEAMLATNCCAGEFLAQQAPDNTALFTTHSGFREERLGEINQFLQKDRPQLAYGELSELAGFTDLLQQLKNTEDSNVILSTLRRLLQPGLLNSQPKPHFGLGFSHYAMITSPIRRYQDLHNQRQIKVLLRQQTPSEPANAIAEQLQPQLLKARQACRQLDQWLLCHYLANQVNQHFTATVVAVSNQGIGVRLDDNGADGFISMRNRKDKPAKYDSTRMQLTYQGHTYHIDQTVTVSLDKVDMENRQLNLSIADC